jgi:small GTP-binding protein
MNSTDAEHQVCGGWRWRSWQDLYIDLIHNELTPPNDCNRPQVYDTYTANIVAEKRSMGLALWDSAGQEEYDKLRPLSYPQAQVFLICFAINSPSSFERVRTKWQAEIQEHCPGVPIILVGTKVDLIGSTEEISQLAARNEQMVQKEKGIELARE